MESHHCLLKCTLLCHSFYYTFPCFDAHTQCEQYVQNNPLINKFNKRRQDQKEFKNFCLSHTPKDGSAVPKPSSTDILVATLTTTDVHLLLCYSWGCFEASNVSSLQCLAILMVKKFPPKFSLDLSLYHDTSWENEPGFFFRAQVQWKGVI